MKNIKTNFVPFYFLHKKNKTNFLAKFISSKWYMFALLLLCLCCVQTAMAQIGCGYAYANLDYFSLGGNQQLFDRMWSNKKLCKGQGIAVFQRWNYFMDPRLCPYDYVNQNVENHIWQAIQEQSNTHNLKNKNSANTCKSGGQWKEVGNYVNAQPQGQGYGRVNFIKLYPETGKPTTAYIGTPGGGIWVKNLIKASSKWQPLTEYNAKYNHNGTTDISALGIIDLAIHPKKPNIMWAITGDITNLEAGSVSDIVSVYNIGVLKTVDGGNTWTKSKIPDTRPYSRYYTILNAIPKKIIVDNNNPDIVYIGSTWSVIKSIDGGENFMYGEGRMSCNIRDVCYKPTGDYKTIYATFDNVFYKSNDDGETWTTSLLELDYHTRWSFANSQIATHPRHPNYVYLVINNGSGGLKGVYFSKDSGNTFTKIYGKSNTEFNILNLPNVPFDTTNQGLNNTGQGNYDLAITTDPADPTGRTLYIGGINVYKLKLNATFTGVDLCKMVSYAPDLNAGANNTANITAQNLTSKSCVFENIHSLKIANNRLIAATDGGVFSAKINGNAPLQWQDENKGLAIRQCHYFANYEGSDHTNMIVSGAQNSGIEQINLPAHSSPSQLIGGGDGGECIINPNNPLNMYVSTQYNEINVTTDGGKTFSTLVATPQSDNYATAKIKIDSIERTAFISKALAFDAVNDILFVGYSNVYAIANPTSPNPTVTKIVPANFKRLRWGQYHLITAIKVAPSNPNILFWVENNNLYKAQKNPNDAWADLEKVRITTPEFTVLTVHPHATFNISISDFVVHPTNPDIIWLTLSDFNRHKFKVLKITKNGAEYDFEDVSSYGLPKIPVNTIALDPSDLSKERLFVGTDCGVYYTEKCTNFNENPQWYPLQGTTPTTKLPNVIVTELEIVGTAPNQVLRAATLGRGVWETTLSNLNNNCICDCTEYNAIVTDTISPPSATIKIPVNNVVPDTIGGTPIFVMPNPDTKAKTNIDATKCFITDINLRPNPVHNKTLLHYTLSNPLHNTEKLPLYIEIYNEMGQKVKQLDKVLVESNQKHDIEIETANLPTGIYNIVVHACEQTYSLKLLKQ